MTFLGGDIRKVTLIIVEVCITSLNPHFRLLGLSTKCWGSSFRIWVKHILPIPKLDPN